MKLLVYSAHSRHSYALRWSSVSASGRASTSSARNETEVVQETLGRALPLPPTATRSTVSASPCSVRAVPHGGDGAAHRLAMTSEGVDAYVGEHVVSARTARAAPLSPVLPEDRPSLPLRQNSAAGRLRRQTLRRRAGACICSARGRHTPDARTEETVRATDSGAYPAVGRWRSDLLPGAGRCGRSRQKKKSKTIRKKCCYSLSPIPCPTRRSRSGCLWHKWLRHLLPVEPTCDIVLPAVRPSLPLG